MEYDASCKLLLFGEYLVLRGSKSLAIPLKFGQKMEVNPIYNEQIYWESIGIDGLWFSARVTKNLEIIETTDAGTASMVLKLLQHIKNKKAVLFEKSYQFKMSADFPLNWGIGSSSTLVSLLAQWSEMDAYELLANSFGGSGYDVACATATSPIIYEMHQHERIESNILSPEITSQLLFVYSGKKQKTNHELSRFETKEASKVQIKRMNTIVLSAANCSGIEEFEGLMEESETMLAPILGMKPLKISTFPDYRYGIKSLGAWGGDFFMASFRNETEARAYFQEKGYDVIFNYEKIIKK